MELGTKGSVVVRMMIDGKPVYALSIDVAELLQESPSETIHRMNERLSWGISHSPDSTAEAIRSLEVRDKEGEREEDRREPGEARS